MKKIKFVFGSYQPENKAGAEGAVRAGTESAVRVGAEARYAGEGSFGFVDERARREQEFLQLPELNSGFEPIWWYQDEELTFIQEGKEGCALFPAPAEPEWRASGRKIPLQFKADMREAGSFCLSVEICNPGTEPVPVILFAGRRHLVWKGTLFAGERRYIRTLIHVCAIVPRGKTQAYEDTSVDIALVGDVWLSSLEAEAVQCPVVYIAGDSTVTDQSAEYPYAPGTSYSGWGQMLSFFLPGCVSVSNHAHSGLTTESFRQEGHYRIVEENLKAGDYVLIQFAHNDQKLPHLLAEGGYRDNLIRYIEEIRAKGAFPVLITPIARNSWKGDDDSYNDFLEKYADTVLATGEALQVPVIDLHKESMAFILEKGLEQAKAWFYPADYTHSNDFGAFRAARVIAAGLGEICPELFAPDEKEKPEECWQPEGCLVLPVCPERMKNKKNPLDEGELLTQIERPDDLITRAEVLPMLIQALKFFPTNVYNDMYRDVIGHEWYAGAVECAWQNGIIPREMTEDGCYHPDSELLLEELLTMAMNGFRGRKKVEPAQKNAQNAALVEQTEKWAQKAVLEGLALGILSEKEEPARRVKRGEAADMIRALAV